VGVLVVHGIGEQHPLDTAQKVVRGLREVYGDELTVGTPDAEHATLTVDLAGASVRVRLYEVYWADLFHAGAHGSFVAERIQTVALFPLLNRRHGLYQPPRSRPGVYAWTALLAVSSTLAYAGWWGIRLLATPWADRPTTRRTGSFLEQARAAADDAARARSPVDRILDDVAGDVFQYVGGSVPGQPAGTAADQVRERFGAQLEAARRDGCDDVQVLAHSLGTVVAYHALTGYRGADDALAGVSRLWTIGSPLSKIAFFYPSMTQLPRPAGAPTWVNFRNPLDPVAGRLRSFREWEVDDRTVWSGGVGRSHTIYERNPHVLEALTGALFGEARVTPASRAARLRGAVEAAGESLLVLVALALPVVAGLMLFTALALLLPWLAGTLVGLVASDGVETKVKDWGAIVVGIPLLLTLLVLGPLADSADEHRVWRVGPSGGGTTTD
jgi:hypothetical protein